MIVKYEHNLEGVFSEAEWESLCDHCGICCLYKIEDYDTHETLYSRLSCFFLDCKNGDCKCYQERFDQMPSCIKISPVSIAEIHNWLPKHCAYRCLYENRPFPTWHPIIQDKSPQNQKVLELIRSHTKGQNLKPMLTWEQILELRDKMISSNRTTPKLSTIVQNIIDSDLF